MILPDVPYERRILEYEDVFPMLYLKYRLKGSRKHKNIKHLVIDEMQDYSYLQYVILNQIFKCRMTILGDKAQTLDEQMPLLVCMFYGSLPLPTFEPKPDNRAFRYLRAPWRKLLERGSGLWRSWQARSQRLWRGPDSPGLLRGDRADRRTGLTNGLR